MILTMLSMALMVGYLSIMAARYGMQETVSSNYYSSSQKWIFSFVMVAAAFLLLPVLLEKGGDFQFLAFFSAMGLALVGVEPHYKSAFSRQIHIGGALAALFAGIGWCLTVNIWPTVIISSLYLLYFVFMGEYKYYIGEVLALLDIYITVLIS